MGELHTTKDQEAFELPIPLKEYCQRMEKLFTAAINDVLREKGFIHCTLPNRIMPLRETMKVCGKIFTIKGAQNLTIEDEMAQRVKMMEDIGEDMVVVWDTDEDDESAQWGEIMTMATKRRGCRGAIIDGGVRDTDRVLSQDFPVFACYRSSNGMLGRFRIVNWQIPIRVGGLTVYPGDFVFGDIDGVVVIPQKIAYDVLLRGEEIAQNEVEIKKMVIDGLSPREVVERGGYF